MTLVSKNGLSFIDLFAIEFEIRREGPLHLTELLDRPLFGPVSGHFEVAFTCDGNLDFVPLLEIERFDNHSAQDDPSYEKGAGDRSVEAAGYLTLNQGNTGIESALNSYLTGTSNDQFFDQINAKGGIDGRTLAPVFKS